MTPWPLSWKSILHFFSWTESPIYLVIRWAIQGHLGHLVLNFSWIIKSGRFSRSKEQSTRSPLQKKHSWCRNLEFQLCHITFVKIDHEIISTVIVPLLLTVGQGLLSLQQVRVEGGMFIFLLFLHFHSFSFIRCPSLSFPLLSLLLPFSGRRHKMTHKGWCVVKPQPNQSKAPLLLIQEGQLSVTGESMCTSTG